MPYFTKKGRISLSGGEQITLLIKSWSGSWREYFKDRREHGKRFSHDQELTDSWIDGGKRLQEFERKHKVRFIVKGSKVVGFRDIPKKVKKP